MDFSETSEGENADCVSFVSVCSTLRLFVGILGIIYRSNTACATVNAVFFYTS